MAEPVPVELFTWEIQREQVFPLLVGLMFMMTLFGIGLLQFYHAYNLLARRTSLGNNQFAVDHLVLAVFLVLDLADTITKCQFITDLVGVDLVQGVAGTYTVPRTVFAIAFTDGLIALCTHLFYARRIYRITLSYRSRKYLWVGLTIAILVSIAQFCAACYSGWVALLPILDWKSKASATNIIWLGGSSAVDFFLCITLVIYLRSHKSAFESTNNMIQRWIRLTLETGLLPALIQLTDLILSFAYRAKPYHLAVNLTLPKAYINSVLILFVTILSNRDPTRMTPVNISITTNPWVSSHKTETMASGQATSETRSRSTNDNDHLSIELPDRHNLEDGNSIVEELEKNGGV